MNIIYILGITAVGIVAVCILNRENKKYRVIGTIAIAIACMVSLILCQKILYFSSTLSILMTVLLVLVLVGLIYALIRVVFGMAKKPEAQYRRKIKKIKKGQGSASGHSQSNESEIERMLEEIISNKAPIVYEKSPQPVVQEEEETIGSFKKEPMVQEKPVITTQFVQTEQEKVADATEIEPTKCGKQVAEFQERPIAETQEQLIVEVQEQLIVEEEIVADNQTESILKLTETKDVLQESMAKKDSVPFEQVMQRSAGVAPEREDMQQLQVMIAQKQYQQAMQKVFDILVEPHELTIDEKQRMRVILLMLKNKVKWI